MPLPPVTTNEIILRLLHEVAHHLPAMRVEALVDSIDKGIAHRYAPGFTMHVSPETSAWLTSLGDRLAKHLVPAPAREAPLIQPSVLVGCVRDVLARDVPDAIKADMLRILVADGKPPSE